MVDPLSDILELVGVKSSVYFQKDFLTPWCLAVSDTGFAQFHIIISGQAVLTYANETIQLSAGDIILFPKGASHLIGDAPESPGLSGQEVITAMDLGEEPFSQGGAATRMICGHFDYDFDFAHPLFQELPGMIQLDSCNLPDKDHLSGLLQLLIRESANNAPGSKVIVRRLSDSLLVTILRSHFAKQSNQAGFHRGLADKRISRAIAAIHSDSCQPCHVDDLASLAGMSRSSFLHHFKALLGQSAGAYATRWKLLKARSELVGNNTSIENIALSAGYNSASAFSRAFQAHFGETPSQHRAGARVKS